VDQAHLLDKISRRGISDSMMPVSTESKLAHHKSPDRHIRLNNVNMLAELIYKKRTEAGID